MVAAAAITFSLLDSSPEGAEALAAMQAQLYVSRVPRSLPAAGSTWAFVVVVVCYVRWGVLGSTE